MWRRSLATFAAGVALAVFSAPVWAGLVAVGPASPGTGNFPVWYQDATPQKLELCLSKTTGPNGALCVLLPSAGVFDPAQPVVFPFNFPDESFYFVADAALNNGGGGVNLTYRAALEAAFANGDVVDGDQIVFARIRIRVDVPSAGTYTITHPYGVDTFTVTTPGVKAINSTVDVGVGAPGVFTGALAGKVGPFLISEKGPITVGTESFIGDPNVLQKVVGGPFGNIVRIQGPGIDLQTNQFFLAGKVFGGVLPTDVSATRATYGRQGTSNQIDVFATSAVGATVTFRETLPLSTERPTNPDGAGNFYGQSPNAPPPFVVVTAAAGAAPPTSVSRRVVDVVKITKAEYVPSTSTLIIEASSSDQVSPPTLTALEFGTLAVIANPVQRLIKTPVVKPPATVTVKSSAGGADTEPVAVVPAATVTPAASADTASTVQGTPVNVNVLANDSGAPILRITGGSVSNPANGTALIVPVLPDQGSDYITYTPNTGFFGTDTFTYTMTDGNNLTSNAAIVTVKVNGKPIAANDTANTSGGAVVINVLANDTDPDGNLPLAVVNLGTPTSGTAVNNGTTVTYTPPPGFTGSTTFTYQAADSLGALSNIATVTVVAGNQPPTAKADSATTLQATPVDINVVANDTDADGTIVASSITLSGTPVGGTVQFNVPAAGFVRFIPNAGTFGNGAGSFSYTVRDNAGATSAPATVTINVTRETVTITSATATRRGTTAADWAVSGTTTVPVITSPTAPFATSANTIQVFSSTNATTAIGTATPDRQGRWKLSVRSTILPAPIGTTTTATAKSALNNSSAAFPVTVK